MSSLPSRFPDSRFPPPPPLDYAAPEGRSAEPAPTRRTMLPWAVKVCLTLAVVGVGATQYLSRVTGEPPALRREAQARMLADDPETTGSLGAAARATTLDPCAILSKLSGR